VSKTTTLSDADVDAIGRELDAIRDDVLAQRGASDAAYIRKVIRAQRALETGGRAALFASLFPPAWLAGTAMLSVSKILENMEIGHNVLHGQWDWMRDPEIHSTTWEWDNATPAADWKNSHNNMHHTWTNVIGKDRDVGYGVIRMSEDEAWHPHHLLQLPMTFLLSAFFQYGIAIYDAEIELVWRKEKPVASAVTHLKGVWKKVRPQLVRDYVAWPLVTGPNAVTTLTANAAANFARNVWSHTIIFCGHFPEDVDQFTEEQIEGESRGDWYLRQLLGSANIEGSDLFHLMTGNLSFQIEHHLFPDLPSNRYKEIAPKVRDLCERYGLQYTTGPLGKQYASTLRRIARLSLPTPVRAAVGEETALRAVA
jgi:NADPH-dependent stearoyl-CoA 9-desaturase